MRGVQEAILGAAACYHTIGKSLEASVRAQELEQNPHDCSLQAQLLSPIRQAIRKL